MGLYADGMGIDCGGLSVGVFLFLLLLGLVLKNLIRSAPPALKDKAKAAAARTVLDVLRKYGK